MNPDINKGNVLYIPIKRKWYDMIREGIKKEEYRGMTPYWTARLVESIETYNCSNCLNGIGYKAKFKDFDFVSLRNGYGFDVAETIFIFEGIEIKTGNPEWGAMPGEEYYTIKVGEIISEKPSKKEMEAARKLIGIN